jgi:hypothetical protein
MERPTGPRGARLRRHRGGSRVSADDEGGCLKGRDPGPFPGEGVFGRRHVLRPSCQNLRICCGFMPRRALSFAARHPSPGRPCAQSNDVVQTAPHGSLARGRAGPSFTGAGGTTGRRQTRRRAQRDRRRAPARRG